METFKNDRKGQSFLLSVAVSFLLLSSAAFTGCGLYTGPIKYKPSYGERKPLGPYVLGVSFWDDKRPYKNFLGVGLAKALMPLVPYASAYADRPEKTSNFIYPKDFSATYFLELGTIRDLRHSRLFKDVVPVISTSNASGADLVLKAHLYSTRLDLSNTWYGLSVGGLYVSALTGLPHTKVSQELVVRYELYKPGTDGPLWSYVVSKKGVGYAGGLGYYHKGLAQYLGDGLWTFSATVEQALNELLSQGMAEMVPRLEDFLRSQPAEFWKK